jgi:hypothetical protein
MGSRLPRCYATSEASKLFMTEFCASYLIPGDAARLVANWPKGQDRIAQLKRRQLSKAAPVRDEGRFRNTDRCSGDRRKVSEGDSPNNAL